MSFQLLRNDYCHAPYEFVAYFPENFDELIKPAVVVFLHGSAERGTDPWLPLKGLDSIFEYLQLPAVVILPQCDDYHRAFYGAMEDRVMWSIEKTLHDFRADSERVYLVGYSMGGSSNLWLAARHPGKFAGIICIAPGITWLGAQEPPNLPIEAKDLFDSMFITPRRPRAIAERVGDVPIWFLQGTDDELCPINETRMVIAELQKLGRQPMVTEYGGMGHETLGRAMEEKGVFEWLFSQDKTAANQKNDFEGQFSEQSLDEQRRDFYSRVASQYDQCVIEEIGYTAYKLVPKKVLALSGLANGTVLDLGCGTGLGAMAFFEANFEVIGIDYSPGMIAVAQMRPFKELFCQSIEDDLPVDKEAFDIVTALGVTEFVKDPARLLAQVWQSLRQGGLCAITLARPGIADGELGIISYTLDHFLKYIDKSQFEVLATDNIFGWESGHLSAIDGNPGQPHHRVDYTALYLRKHNGDNYV